MFSEEDKHLIQFYRKTRHLGVRRLLKLFPEKNWSRGGLEKLVAKIDETGNFKRRPGSGRPRTARTNDVIEKVEELVLSQENAPNTHSSQRKIARQTGISVTSVNRIIKNDLQLRCLKKRRAHELTNANKQTRLDRCQKLLKRYSAAMVNFIWFTDEKLFTVAAPSNTQNDRLYAAVGVRKKNIAPERLLRIRPTFSKSVMVSVGVSALGRTSLHFIDPGVKINGKYYRDTLLKNQLLPEIKQYSEFFTFQQDSAPAPRARETVELLQRETPDLIPPTLWPPNSPDLNPVDFKIWGTMQERVYSRQIRNVDELKERILEEWEKIDQPVIDSAVAQWRPRLQARVAAQGGHFEHMI